MKTIDLRSDTITKPTETMRRAMASAEVGDDVFGEDPTIAQLEELAAEKTGKEAALFVASGTMGNLVSQLTHCNRGDEVILGNEAHIFTSEQAGAATLGGISLRIVPNQPDGKILPEDIVSAIRPPDPHCPTTQLITLENTHNRCNGSPLGVDYMNTIGELAKEKGLKLHIDGARIFNAAVALGTTAKELAEPADSIQFCLSKGLGAPVGSMVCGNSAFIMQARRARKVLGGGMRQAGVLAAAGLVALNENVDRMAEDHENARKLAEGLAGMAGVSVDPDDIKTNIVFFKITKPGLTPAVLAQQLASEGVRIGPKPPDQMRAVTNYHITSDDIDHTLGVFEKVL